MELPCGAKLEVTTIRTVSKANSDNPKYLPYADLFISTEDAYVWTDLEENQSAYKVNLPIQLRSIDPLISFLTKLKEELQK